MEKINNVLDRMAAPLGGMADWLLRLGLGISFFLHGYGKMPIGEGFIGWLASKGVPAAGAMAHMVAWGEMLAGIGIILGGLLIKLLPVLANFLTRLSSLSVIVIMICALIIAHSDWSIFVGERGKVLFASEQLFLITLGFYFFIKGND